MAAAESEIAAKLIERLLADPAFRDRFRRNPASACREAGLESLAEEMQLGAGKAMHTLDIRESRSSLAGVMMAAAMEGMGVYEFSQHVVPHLEDLSGAVGDVLSRVNLPALPGAGALSGGPKASAAAVTAPRATARPRSPMRAATARGAAPRRPPPDAAKEAPTSPEEAATKPGKEPAAQGRGERGAEPAGDKKPGGGGGAAPEAPELAGLGDGRRAGGATRTPVDEPAGSELPTGDVEPQASQGGPEPGAQKDPPAAAAAPAAAPEPQASSQPVDPSQLGQDGTGGKPDKEALALLENKNVVLDDVGVADIKDGRIDPRIVGVLTKLSQEHKIVVSCMCSDHSKFTTGGSVSNHAFGRGLDIASIDGEIVSPGSALAREVASELSEFDPALRPDEIGSPFAINGPGYFTDAAHSNHIHVGFKTEITPDFKLPADVSATAAPAAPAVAAPVAGAPAAAAAAVPEVAAIAEPAAPKRASGLFGAIPEPGKVAAAGAAGEKPAIRSCSCRRSPHEQQPAQPVACCGGAGRSGGGRLTGVPGAYPGDDAPKEQIAAWMAAEAEKRGLPAQLPVMAALVESNLTNVNFGDADSLGYFQMRVSIWESQYPGFADDPAKSRSTGSSTPPNASRHNASAAANRSPTPTSSANGSPTSNAPPSNTAAATNSNSTKPTDYSPTPQNARRTRGRTGRPPHAAGAPRSDPVVDAGAVGPGGGGASSIGAAALRVAETQRGVREIGSNTGPQVDRYLEAAGVPPGNPWCASFLAWSLEKAGHKMPGGGWAGVATWVRNAEQGSNGLKLVSADEARPGDIAAYDWGGGNDFGADGHIGFLASSVNDGQFTALEGNNADAVNVVPRQLGDANIVFIRVEGDAPAGTAPIDPGQAAVAAAAAAPEVAAIAEPAAPKRASGCSARCPSRARSPRAGEARRPPATPSCSCRQSRPRRPHNSRRSRPRPSRPPRRRSICRRRRLPRR